MKPYLFNRRIHYWLSPLVALPLLVMIGTGVLMHLRKQSHWVQPTEQKGSSKIPAVSFEKVLEACRGVPEAEVSAWADIGRVDVRPAKGILKVTCRNNWEVQIDLGSGEVLQAAYRRSDIINSIHEGAYFGDGVKWYIFLPAALSLFVLLGTGLWMFLSPLARKWRRKRITER